MALVRLHRRHLPRCFVYFFRHSIVLGCIYALLFSLPLAQSQGLKQALNQAIFPQQDSCHCNALGTRYGAVLNANVNIHTANFRQLPGIPFCCPSFGGGTGEGYTVGLLYGFPISTNTLLHFRTTLSTHDALLSSEHYADVVVNGSNTNGKAAHEFDTRLVSIGIEPLVGYHVGDGLFVHGGFRLAALEKALFRQEDRITQPMQDATFINPITGVDTRQNTRYQASGELDRLLFQAGLVVGSSYEIPINRTGSWILSPEVFFYYSLTPLMSGIAWHTHSLRGGISLLYTPKPVVTSRYDTLYLRDTVVRTIAANREEQFRFQKRTISTRTQALSQYEDAVTTTITDHYLSEVPEKQERIRASLAIAAVDEAGQERTLGSMRIEEFRSDEYHPLLPYIFFDSASARIPTRYIQYVDSLSANSFREEALPNHSTLSIYYQLLNIIGSRLRRFPQTSITLTGCNSSNGGKENDSAISLARAMAIREYLLNIWGIDEQRIGIESRALPLKPSNSTLQDGNEENRRVEIRGSAPLLTDVVRTHDTLRRANPPVLRFTPQITSSAAISHWMLSVEDEDSVLAEFGGKGMPPPSIDWRAQGESLRLMAGGNSPLKATLFLKSDAGLTARSHRSFDIERLTIQHKLEERLGDTIIERYGMLLFDYGSPDIDPQNNPTIAFLRSRLQPNSRLWIEGYTDRTGDAETNLRLSTERADETAQAVGRNTAQRRGYGNSILLYDNSLPEGRHYCRTVRIRVENPQQQ